MITRDQWKYLVEVLLSPECQDVLSIVTLDEVTKRGSALRTAVKQADWHSAAQHLGRIDQLNELPNLLKRYAEDNRPGPRS